jgi:hypothetical protein
MVEGVKEEEELREADAPEISFRNLVIKVVEALVDEDEVRRYESMLEITVRLLPEPPKLEMHDSNAASEGALDRE